MKTKLMLCLLFALLFCACGIAAADAETAAQPEPTDVPAGAETPAVVEAPADMTLIPLDTRSTGTEKPADYAEKVLEKGSGSVTITYSTEADVDLKAGILDFWYKQSWYSSHSAYLQVVYTDENGAETLLGESGEIPQGYRMNGMKLLAELPAGTYSAALRVFFYTKEDPDALRTSVPLTVIFPEKD